MTFDKPMSMSLRRHGNTSLTQYLWGSVNVPFMPIYLHSNDVVVHSFSMVVMNAFVWRCVLRSSSTDNDLIFVYEVVLTSEKRSNVVRFPESPITTLVGSRPSAHVPEDEFGSEGAAVGDIPAAVTSAGHDDDCEVEQKARTGCR